MCKYEPWKLISSRLTKEVLWYAVQANTCFRFFWVHKERSIISQKASRAWRKHRLRASKIHTAKKLINNQMKGRSRPGTGLMRTKVGFAESSHLLAKSKDQMVVFHAWIHETVNSEHQLGKKTVFKYLQPRKVWTVFKHTGRETCYSVIRKIPFETKNRSVQQDAIIIHLKPITMNQPEPATLRCAVTVITVLLGMTPHEYSLQHL